MPEMNRLAASLLEGRGAIALCCGDWHSPAIDPWPDSTDFLHQHRARHPNPALRRIALAHPPTFKTGALQLPGCGTGRVVLVRLVEVGKIQLVAVRVLKIGEPDALVLYNRAAGKWDLRNLAIRSKCSPLR